MNGGPGGYLVLQTEKGWEEKMKPGGHSKNSEVKWLERVKGAGRMAASVG